MKRETRKLVRRMKFHRLASAAKPMRTATIMPARTPGVSNAFMTSRTEPTKTIVRHASPNSNLRIKSMLLHAPVERPAAQPEVGSGERDVEMVHSKRALDHLLFQLVEVEQVARARHGRGGVAAPRQREI